MMLNDTSRSKSVFLICHKGLNIEDVMQLENPLQKNSQYQLFHKYIPHIYITDLVSHYKAT